MTLRKEKPFTKFTVIDYITFYARLNASTTKIPRFWDNEIREILTKLMWLSRDLALLNFGSIQNGWCQKLEDENRLPSATNPYVDKDINHGDDHHASDDAARSHSEPKYPDHSHSEPNLVEPQASTSDAARSGPNDWDGYRIPKRKKTAQRT